MTTAASASKLVTVFDDDDRSDLNEPAVLPTRGTGGSFVIDKAKREKLKRTAEGLLTAGVPHVECIVALRDTFQLTDEEASGEIEKAYERILAESERRKPFNRATTERRILETIRKAVKRNQFNAVANLEGKLAEIQGTNAPTEHKVQVDARLSQATLTVLGSLHQDEIEELVQEELGRLALKA